MATPSSRLPAPHVAGAYSCADHGPPADPRTIHLSYTHRHPCHPGTGTARTWHIRADVRYGGIRLADEDPAGHVGDIRIVTIDPAAADDRRPTVDDTNPDLRRVAKALLDPATGRLTRALTRQIGRRRGHHRTLILDHAQLTPPWRGFGLGVLLTGEAIKTLSAGCRLAACYPAPPARPHTDRADPVEVQLAHATLGEVFEQLGFEHLHDGIFILDLTSRELDRSLARLRTRIDEPGHTALR